MPDEPNTGADLGLGDGPGDGNNNGPPSLTVTAGSHPVPVQQGSYCWTENGVGICGDTPGPTELLQETPPTVVAPAATVQLSYGRRPTYVTVNQWGDGEPKGTNVTDTLTFSAPAEAGVYVYSASARWEEGDAFHAFHMQVK